MRVAGAVLSALGALPVLLEARGLADFGDFELFALLRLLSACPDLAGVGARDEVVGEPVREVSA